MSRLGFKVADSAFLSQLETDASVESKVVKTGCCSSQEWYMFNQAFAVVRHAERLDHDEQDWANHPDKEAFPNDPPLAEKGREHAHEVGAFLGKMGKPWKVIISSPYYRCAETASCIAEKLDIPVHFDLDLGEIFDRDSMQAGCDGSPQHRSEPAILHKKLKEDFPTVKYVRGDDGSLKVDGKQQRWEEPLHAAKMRFCYKIKKIIQQAASELCTVIIVSHGDSLSSVLSMLKETWVIAEIPYAGYFVAERQVKVMKHVKAGEGLVLTDEPVYENPDQWKLTVDPGIKQTDARKSRLEGMHQAHEKDLQAMQKNKNVLTAWYKLEPTEATLCSQKLGEMDCSEKDSKLLMAKASSSSFGRSSRILCKPGEDRELTRGSVRYSVSLGSQCVAGSQSMGGTVLLGSEGVASKSAEKPAVADEPAQEEASL